MRQLLDLAYKCIKLNRHEFEKIFLYNSNDCFLAEQIATDQSYQGNVKTFIKIVLYMFVPSFTYA